MNASMRLLSIACILGLGAVLAADGGKKRPSPIEGNWVIESATAGDMKIDVMGEDKKNVRSFSWVFAGESYQAFVNDGAAAEEGTFVIDSDKSPKHLDLIPKKGEILTTAKCIYALDGDVLQIAMTVWFAPSTPEQEAEEAKKMRATRPTSLKSTKENPIVVLVLKRQKT